MELTLKGEAKEIAVLVLELQGRQDEGLPNYVPLDIAEKAVQQAIGDIVAEEQSP